MKKKLIIYNFLVIVFSLAVMFGLDLAITKKSNTEQAESKVIAITDALTKYYDENTDYTKELGENVRVTVIKSDGTVISDNMNVDVSTLGNHLNREEIVAAANDTPKTVTRYSDTLETDMLYYAEKVNLAAGYVFLRVAVPVKSLRAYYKSTIPSAVAVLVIALVLSAIMSLYFGNQSLRPLARVRQGLQAINYGIYKPIMPTSDDDEINKMLNDINDISKKVQENMETLAGEQDKLKYILNNVSDGIIVFDEKGEIVLMNSKAVAIFGVSGDYQGRIAASLTSDLKFASFIKDAVQKGINSTFEMEYKNLDYLCTAVKTDNGVTVTVVTDVTTTKSNEKMRSEFFANASHELKTPLTSIIGFNDLTAMQNKDDSLKPYIDKIGLESKRMLTLIEDMLKLSKLEITKEVVLEKVNVKEVADEVVESLKAIADNRKVSLTASGKGYVLAEKDHVYELIKNLAENAVKYNREGGRAEIIISGNSQKCNIEVKDDGIGIPDESLTRIFERFYRVEKSRSRGSGGTGLGLAIVKHISEIYKAKINLSSKLNFGTDISVEFTNNIKE